MIDDDGERLVALRSTPAPRSADLAGRVTFTGALADPRHGPRRRATCLLHCADVEPYGMVLVEALAAGHAVVAPASGGPAEIVAPETGRLFLPGDARSAADALVEVLGTEGLAARIGAAGRARAERHYRLEDSTARYERLLDELIERRRRGDCRDAAVRPREPRRAPAEAGAAESAPGTGIALVTVTHDSEPELRALLASVERHLPGARVVVVDSGSSRRRPRRGARLADGRATSIDLGENVGLRPRVQRGRRGGRTSRSRC